MPTLGRRRAYGQHFLHDRSLASRIAQAAIEQAVQAQSRALLEIGPGRGALTEPLLASRPDVDGMPLPLILCEKDRALAETWTQRAAKERRIQVEDADFLNLAEERWLSTTPLTVVSNLPYSSGTAILDRLARQSEKIPSMVLMFQAEVAQRLRATPGTKAWGSLSIWIQNQWWVDRLFGVPPGAFSPPPQVDSEVVVLTRRTECQVAVPRDEKSQASWESLLKACFAHRRKMLRSSLPTGSAARNALWQAGVDGTKRAEALTWNEWAALFSALQDAAS